MAAIAQPLHPGWILQGSDNKDKNGQQHRLTEYVEFILENPAPKWMLWPVSVGSKTIIAETKGIIYRAHSQAENRGVIGFGTCVRKIGIINAQEEPQYQAMFAVMKRSLGFNGNELPIEFVAKNVLAVIELHRISTDTLVSPEEIIDGRLNNAIRERPDGLSKICSEDTQTNPHTGTCFQLKDGDYDAIEHLAG